MSKPRDLAAQYKEKPCFHVAGLYCSKVYPVDAPVGKSCTQVKAGSGSGKKFETKDSEIHDRWSQAIASAEALLWRGIDDYDHFGKGAAKSQRSTVLPILVIPDGTLWVCDYDEAGAATAPPLQVAACEFYLGKVLKRKKPAAAFLLGHLHIVTLTGLTKLVSDLADFGDTWRAIFPDDFFCNPVTFGD